MYVCNTTIPVISAHYSMHTMQNQSQVFDAKNSHLKINHNAMLFNIAPWSLNPQRTDLLSVNKVCKR